MDGSRKINRTYITDRFMNLLGTFSPATNPKKRACTRLADDLKKLGSRWHSLPEKLQNRTTVGREPRHAIDFLQPCVQENRGCLMSAKHRSRFIALMALVIWPSFLLNAQRDDSLGDAIEAARRTRDEAQLRSLKTQLTDRTNRDPKDARNW